MDPLENGPARAGIAATAEAARHSVEGQIDDRCRKQRQQLAHRQATDNGNAEGAAHFGTGWQAGPETPSEAARIVTAIRLAASAAGRAIDADHYGASFPFHFGRATDPLPQRATEAYKRRTGRDADAYFVIGDADAIVARIADYVAAGCSKFVLRPLAAGDEEVLTQTRLLVEQVLPVTAIRWPRAATK